MAQQDESATSGATSHDNFKEEALSQASKIDFKNEAFSQASQKPPISGQAMTASTPRNMTERRQTLPLNTNSPESSPPQSESQESQSPRPHGNGEDENQADGFSDSQRGNEAADPHVLPDFDWDRLEKEYLETMNKATDVESELSEEFKLLANFFANWSNVSYSQDESRAFKRFRTREEHVRHSEDKFEEKKMHYEKVINALKAAMELLQSN